MHIFKKTSYDSATKQLLIDTRTQEAATFYRSFISWPSESTVWGPDFGLYKVLRDKSSSLTAKCSTMFTR